MKKKLIAVMIAASVIGGTSVPALAKTTDNSNINCKVQVSKKLCSSSNKYLGFTIGQVAENNIKDCIQNIINNNCKPSNPNDNIEADNNNSNDYPENNVEDNTVNNDNVENDSVNDNNSEIIPPNMEENNSNNENINSPIVDESEDNFIAQV